MPEPPEHEEAFPRLPRELFALVQAAGERRSVAAGDVLTRSGEVVPEFYVVASGALEGYADYGSPTERLVGEIGERGFWGGTNLMAGQPAYVTTVAPEDSELIVLSTDQLRGMISANQEWAIWSWAHSSHAALFWSGWGWVCSSSARACRPARGCCARSAPATAGRPRGAADPERYQRRSGIKLSLLDLPFLPEEMRDLLPGGDPVAVRLDTSL